LTAPADYAEEAAFYFGLAETALGRKPRSWLELGSGGGNNASHYKAWVEGEVVLSDRSPEMLALSSRINPNLEHVRSDMLTIRLGRDFDVVFVHDAAAYLTTDVEVRRLAETLALHTTAGGVTLICPDHTAENLVFETDHGGHDGTDGRALRYLEWMYPGRPGTHEYYVDYAYVLHEQGKDSRVVLDRHTCGALPRETWLSALRDADFEASATPLVHSEVPEGSSEVFMGIRR
jgi:hypothetical protein